MGEGQCGNRGGMVERRWEKCLCVRMNWLSWIRNLVKGKERGGHLLRMCSRAERPCGGCLIVTQ